jgi:LDH2 family malate/lactate/ureidoglycolate dehydrogenase
VGEPAETIEGARRYRPDDLIAFAADLFAAAGVAPADAAVTAERLVEADLRGRTGHGLIRVGSYLRRIRGGAVNVAPVMTVVNETAASAQIDADNGLGQVAMTRATELAVDKAEQAGVGWVGTVRSNHAGAAGVYPALAARRGMLAIYLAVANGNAMPAWGGAVPLLGTNPLAIGVPAGEGSPFVLDIATTVASHGTIDVAARSGSALPEGWVVDQDGAPITDPALADRGFLVPIGGYKGAGLNIAIGLLAGVLNGAAFGGDVVDHRDDDRTPTNTGQAILVIRPDLFLPADVFATTVAAKLDELRASGPHGEDLLLPGDRAARSEAEQRRSGIPLPPSLAADLERQASELGVSTRPKAIEEAEESAR